MCRHISLAAFISLGNVRPRFRSSLKAIYLVSLARSEDIDKYGLDKFLTLFVERFESYILRWDHHMH